MSCFFATATSPASEMQLSVLIWATAGGIAVFVGLILEKTAEWLNERFLGGSEHPHKKLGEVGWVILMLGIVIEISDAGSTAIELWQTKLAAINNAPNNAIIGNIFANVIFEVRGTNAVDLDCSSSVLGDPGIVCSLAILDPKSRKDRYAFSSFLPLRAYSFSRVNGGENRTYSLQFIAPASMMETMTSDWGLGRKYRAKNIFDVSALEMSFAFLPSNSEILSGSVNLVVNGSIQMNFHIPRQIDASLSWGFTNLPVFFAFATNSTKMSSK
jgi:hypothetical protein